MLGESMFILRNFSGRWPASLVAIDEGVPVDRLHRIGSYRRRAGANLRFVGIGDGDRLVETVADIHQFADTMKPGVLISRLPVDPLLLRRSLPLLLGEIARRQSLG